MDRKRSIRGNVIEHVMTGKDCANANGTRAHKITLQATIPGVIRLVHMIQLPVDVLQQFQQGNRVVKGSDGRFNQIDSVHSRSG